MIYWDAKQQRIESISLSGNQNSGPSPKSSYDRNEASKTSPGIYEKPVLPICLWCNGALRDSGCHSAFSEDKGNNVCKGWCSSPALCYSHCSCVLLAEPLPVFLRLHEAVCELLQGKITSVIPYIAFCSGVTNGIFHHFVWRFWYGPNDLFEF